MLAGYTLTYACLLITASRLGDRYGYRRLFAVGAALFTAASAACSLAPTVHARRRAAAPGRGQRRHGPQVLSLIQTGLPARRRPHALGLFGVTMAVASLAGPLLGGLLIQADLWGLGWRLIFLVNLPVGAAALAGARLLPATRGTGARRVDAVGAVLAVLGLGALILPLATGPDLGWPPWTWAVLAAAPVLLALFAWSQSARREPLLHPAVLRDRVTRVGVVLVLVFNTGVPSFTYLLLAHLQAGGGRTPVQAALVTTPFAFFAAVGSRMAPGSPAAGRAAAHVRRRRARAGHGGARPGRRRRAGPVAGAAAAGAGRCRVRRLHGVGVLLVLAGVAPDAVGSASGALPTAQQVGGSVGVTLAGIVYATADAGSAAAFGHAMAYQTGVFLLAAALSLRLTR
ncbi:MFS transporter [Streptomyces sp. M19]